MKSNTNSLECPNQSSQPMFQPSIKRPWKPLAEAKSMYSLTFVLLAACFPFGVNFVKSVSPMCTLLAVEYAHCDFPMIISHQTPIYFVG